MTALMQQSDCCSQGRLSYVLARVPVSCYCSTTAPARLSHAHARVLMSPDMVSVMCPIHPGTVPEAHLPAHRLRRLRAVHWRGPFWSVCLRERETHRERERERAARASERVCAIDRERETESVSERVGERGGIDQECFNVSRCGHQVLGWRCLLCRQQLQEDVSHQGRELPGRPLEGRREGGTEGGTEGGRGRLSIRARATRVTYGRECICGGKDF